LSTFSRWGFSFLFKGHLVSLLKYFPTQSFTFAFKDLFKREYKFVRDDDSKLKPGKISPSFFLALLHHLSAGAFAGTATLLILYPLDTIATRLACDIKGEFRGIWQTMRKGLYAGLGESLMGIAVYRALYFGLYDALREFLPRKASSRTRFLFAQAVTVTAALVSYPLDTLRRRKILGIATSSYEGAGMDVIARDLYKGALWNTARELVVSFALLAFHSLPW